MERVSPPTTAEETPELWLKEDKGPREPEGLIHLPRNPVAHPMLEHVALADPVEEHGEAGHLAEAGPLEGLEVEAAEAAGVSHRNHAPSNSIRSKFQCRGTGL